MYENISNINEVMRMCDIAVSAAGNTLYELCAVGTPTIFLHIHIIKNMIILALQKMILCYMQEILMMGKKEL